MNGLSGDVYSARVRRSKTKKYKLENARISNAVFSKCDKLRKPPFPVDGHIYIFAPYPPQRRRVGGWRTVLLYELAPHVALLEGMCQADNPLNVNVNHCNVDEYKLDVYK